MFNALCVIIESGTWKGGEAVGETLAGWLYGALESMKKKPDHILHNNAVREDLQTLEPAGNTLKRQKEYVIKKFSLCIMIVVTGVILSTALWIKDEMAAEIVDNRLARNTYGGGEKSIVLEAADGKATYDISLNVGEKSYTQAELMALSGEMIPLMEKGMLGDNQSLDRVEYDLNLMNSMEGYPFEISWSVDEAYIDYEGHLVNNVLSHPQLVEISAKLCCESFVLEHYIDIMVYTKAVQPDTAAQIAEQARMEESGSRTSEYVTLPSEIGGQELRWRYKKGCGGLLFLIATPLIAILVYYGRDRDLHKQVEDREEQMRFDYPEIVSALALLIGAGMTVPNAWNKIVSDYGFRKEETGKSRYAYEEMLLAVHEMESGVAQTKAYERFGRRCRIPDYNKLSTMLAQNIRKGAANLPALLKAEAADAFEERKHMARKLGEKAGTKLLVPMMMLLGMIMVVIMIPAFKNYL